MERKVKIGLIGTGNISPAYIKGCPAFDILDLVACADLNMDKARDSAEKNQLQAMTVDELLANPEIEIAINLTIPAAHASVSLAALSAGKHVYSEKPFAVTREDGQKILALARDKNLRVGCAPDTFLFGALQTCRKLIDEGAIGEPVSAVAHMVGHGHESWHPSPDFYYQRGGGPLFDMGPYYLTALVNFLGPVRRVTASARASFSERIASSKGNEGRRLPVEVPTHYAGVLDFASGVIANVIMSFDVWGHNLPMMEIYGSEGSLSVPDPNGYGHTVKLLKPGGAWAEIPLTHPLAWVRGIGVADMAYGIVHGRPHRASGDLAYHVLDVMHAFADSSDTNQHIALSSTVSRPAALPTGLPPRQLDT